MATPEFNMKKVTTPLLLHLLSKEMRFPKLFLLMRKLTLNRFKKSIEKRFPQRFPRELVDLVALPGSVYLNLKKKIGQKKAFEIMRVAILTGGTATQNLQFDTVHKERTFDNFIDLELENNRTGIIRWNSLEVVARTPQRFEMKITRCMFHELATALGFPEITPIICQIDNAMYNSYLPDQMTFDRGGVGRRISDGNHECNFIWELRHGQAAVTKSVKAGLSAEPSRLKIS
jgi:hypothetical protein